ncbi:MAG: hypothetical protein LC640_10945, partial [Frankia sp.]|nr:hypothetical protein [Frankia sp.]
WGTDQNGVGSGRVLSLRDEQQAPHLSGPIPADVVPLGTMSTFRAVSPVRVLDTRSGLGAPAGKVTGSITLPIRGVATNAGPVPDNATAVVLNVTATGGTSGVTPMGGTLGTQVTVLPSGRFSDWSNLIFAPGQTVANSVTVALGADGAITLGSYEVHLIADLTGWYEAGTALDRFTPLDPRRIADTRRGLGVAQMGRVGAGSYVDLQVVGALGTADGDTVAVPADAHAVVLNITATQATSSTDVRAYPTPGDNSFPRVSTLNVVPGETAPNLAVVRVGTDGRIRLRNAAGQVHLIVDLVGYYAAGAGAAFLPVLPLRVLSTRSAVGAPPLPLPAGIPLDVRVAGRRGIPPSAVAVSANIVGSDATSSTDVRLFPSAANTPTVSNLNLVPGRSRAIGAILRPDGVGVVRVLNRAGSVHVVADVAGYFAVA